MDFNVGDRVRLTGKSWKDIDSSLVNMIVMVGGHDIEWGPTFHVGEAEYYVYDEGDGGDFSATLVEAATPDQDPTDPNYYQFPDGHEVRHISAHLTSFGGQALQYVARSTRLDGINKGNLIEDLEKAQLFIGWEIDRLRG